MRVAFVSTDFPGQGWPWPHQAHVAHQDIPELGQFIEGVLSHPPAATGDAGVAADLEEHTCALIPGIEFFQTRFGVHHHGTELQHVEGGAPPANPLLPEKYGAGAVMVDYGGEEQQDR
ncbi:hypothetical protein D3C73_1260980 [compost metagenome]